MRFLRGIPIHGLLVKHVHILNNYKISHGLVLGCLFKSFVLAPGDATGVNCGHLTKRKGFIFPARLLVKRTMEKRVLRLRTCRIIVPRERKRRKQE